MFICLKRNTCRYFYRYFEFWVDSVKYKTISFQYIILISFQLRSGSGLFVLPAKMPANLVTVTEENVDSKSKDTVENGKTDTSENKLASDVGDVPNRNIQDMKESKMDKDALAANSVEVTADVNQVIESATDTLTEKERKKLEKAKRKEERRKRKEEKKAKREKSKERDKEPSKDSDIVADPVSDNGVINDVNQPQSTNGAMKTRVSFQLDDSVVKPGVDRDIRPLTAPHNVRALETINQSENIDRNRTQSMEDYWNIEDDKLETPTSRRVWAPHQSRVSDSEEEILERRKTVNIFV